MRATAVHFRIDLPGELPPRRHHPPPPSPPPRAPHLSLRDARSTAPGPAGHAPPVRRRRRRRRYQYDARPTSDPVTAAHRYRCAAFALARRVRPPARRRRWPTPTARRVRSTPAGISSQPPAGISSQPFSDQPRPWPFIGSCSTRSRIHSLIRPPPSAPTRPFRKRPFHSGQFHSCQFHSCLFHICPFHVLARPLVCLAGHTLRVSASLGVFVPGAGVDGDEPHTPQLRIGAKSDPRRASDQYHNTARASKARPTNNTLTSSCRVPVHNINYARPQRSNEVPEASQSSVALRTSSPGSHPRRAPSVGRACFFRYVVGYRESVN